MDKILVVVDMQNDFVTGSLRNEDTIQIIPNVKKKIEGALASEIPVCFTQDTHLHTYPDTEEGINLPIPHCVEGSWGQEIIPELEKYSNNPLCIVYKKNTFGCIPLGERLSRLGPIKEIEIIGICTDICVISNALLLKAFCPNAHIMVDASCCAGVTPESHKTALEAMKACQIEIVGD